jgi:hypothetical protein
MRSRCPAGFFGIMEEWSAAIRIDAGDNGNVIRKDPTGNSWTEGGSAMGDAFGLCRAASTLI